MDTTMTLNSGASDSELEAAITHVLGEIEAIRRRIQSDQDDIERSQSRTRAMLKELQVTLKVS